MSEGKLDQMAIKEGKKTFLIPGGFSPTAAGNSEEQTVYWNCMYLQMGFVLPS